MPMVCLRFSAIWLPCSRKGRRGLQEPINSVFEQAEFCGGRHMRFPTLRAGLVGLAVAGSVAASNGALAQVSVFQATLAEPNAKTAEVSTQELQRILADGSAIVLDSRKRSEYAAGHIAGARNVSPPNDAPTTEYAAAVERLVGGDKDKPLVLYCNGAHCQASRQLSE